MKLTDLRRDIRSLTGLRGVAALLVVVFHYDRDLLGQGAAGAILRHGYLAVDLFFILSGFVMAMNYARLFEGGFTRAAYGQFLARRAGRILPLYVFLSLVCLALRLHHNHEWPAGWMIPANILLIQGWGIARSLDNPAWSISTEVSAYLLFPIIAVGLLFRGWGRSVLGAIACVVGLCLVAYRPDHWMPALDIGQGLLNVSHPGTVFPLLRCVTGFGLGVFGWRLFGVDPVRRVFAHPGAALGLTAVIAGLMAVPNADIAITLLCVPLILALATDSSPVARLLGAAPVHWLGVVSYSIYLVHQPVLDALRTPLLRHVAFHHAYTAITLGLVGVSVALAGLCYYAVERPTRRWSRRLSSKPAPQSAPNFVPATVTV